ncbi:hypothetical protein QE152_g7786 [Popillia japonica]|uniref:Uncharacterized protein n=1 Tax=Popillia japonica TaxID=7064 RepID=A0AAW1MF44_POPJA
MADLMSAVKEMMIEIREMIKEQKEYHETLKEITIENKKLKEEKIEKDQRKSNIIIKSEDFQHNIGKEQVKQFIEEKIGVPVEIEEVQVISNNKKHQTIVRAKINSFENEVQVISNNKKHQTIVRAKINSFENKILIISNNKKHQTIVRAKINSFENKILIMKNKCKLKGSKHYIESDFTKSEEKIQKKLREIAKEERQ